jgi:RimJ/RimL family protein N-acetyltransferase
MAGIRKIEPNDADVLFPLLANPKVIRFSRIKPNTIEELSLSLKALLNEENEQQVIPRVIVDIENNPIGMIILWDYCPFRKEGFLATWLGEDYWGMGYNEIAKSLFFDELFALHYLENIFLLIRNHNHRSLAAAQKFPYITVPEMDKTIELKEFYGSKIQEDHIILVINKEIYQNFLLEGEKSS